MEAGLLILQSSSEIVSLIAKRIKARRKFLKLSQKELAEKSGVSLQTIFRLENKGIATLGVVVKVAVALDSIDSFAELFKNPSANNLVEYEKILRLES